MKLKKSKQVTKVSDVTVGYKCDNCGAIVKADSLPDKWYNFTSHHNEWDNDSIDSYESCDVCSAKCYIEKLTDVVENKLNERTDAQVDHKEIQFARKLVEYFKSVDK